MLLLVPTVVLPAHLYFLFSSSFVQILVKLCTFVSPAEELAQKDDLQLLFSAITSWCPPHNLPWRRSAGEVLTTISRHGLSVNVVKYIHGIYISVQYIQNICVQVWVCLLVTAGISVHAV